jgi:ABC-type Mn2+/Zn2+ transport system ATPase subunit
VTVLDVVSMGRYPYGRWPHRPTQYDKEVVRRTLSRVDMLDYAQTQIGQLSGGQQQRVFIARALAQEGEVLLLDEPMTGIDAATQEVVLAIIEEQSRLGTIILLATHDLVSASCACDCLCCVNERMISYGPVETTYTADNLALTFGGPVIVLGRSQGTDHIQAGPSVHHHPVRELN